MRAIVPSRASVRAHAVTITVPQKSSPRAPKPRAPIRTPTVPATVTAFGVTPRRSRRRAVGLTTYDTRARAGTLTIFAMAVPP
jgi:hypothetical protein